MSSLNPISTLYRETPCEVCGEPVGEHDGPVTDSCEGSGGSREEVTIDYEAALRLLESDAGENLPSGWAVAVVDAALKSAGFTKKFASGEPPTE